MLFDTYFQYKHSILADCCYLVYIDFQSEMHDCVNSVANV